MSDQEDGAPIPIHRVEFAEAKQLADRFSIHQELSYLIEVLDRLLLIDDPQEDFLFASSLWSTALISYCRCFSTGRRTGLGMEVFDAFHPSAKDFHKWLTGLRDKHIAHSVNPFEQVAVGLLVRTDPETSEPAVIGVSNLSIKHIGIDQEPLSQFRDLAQNLRRLVERECESLRQVVLQIGQDMPGEAVTRLPILELTPPGPDEAGKPRPA